MRALIGNRRAVALLLGIASLGLASCDQLAALSGPAHHYIIEADLDGVQPGDKDETVTAEAMQESMEVITRRLAAAGIRIVSITPLSDGRISLETSGADDAETMAYLLGQRGEVAVRLVDMNAVPGDAERGIAPPGSEILPLEGGHHPPLPVRRLGGISGQQVASAMQAFDSRTNEPIVVVQFDQDGAGRFARLTQENVGQHMAVVVDDVVVTSGVITEPILGGSIELMGDFSVTRARELAAVIASGDLPVTFSIVRVQDLD